MTCTNSTNDNPVIHNLQHELLIPCLFDRIILHCVVNFSSFLFRYGCPSMEELDSYNQEFKKRLDEVGALGEIPDDLGLEVIGFSNK